jgi:hypothetical protein
MKPQSTCACVVGLQWGDEAKGKIVDLIGDDYHFVVRYNGGANAGHTVVWGNRTFKLSLLPTGILKPNLCSVIGNGLVVYPPRLLEEIEQLKSAGVKVAENLAVSDHAHGSVPATTAARQQSAQLVAASAPAIGTKSGASAASASVNYCNRSFCVNGCASSSHARTASSRPSTAPPSSRANSMPTNYATSMSAMQSNCGPSSPTRQRSCRMG